MISLTGRALSDRRPKMMQRPCREVAYIVRQDYPSAVAEDVIAFLLSVSADLAAWRQDCERLQTAAFILLRGDANRIPYAKSVMKRDWRDGLVWSGLGNGDWPNRLNQLLGSSRHR